MRNTTRLLLVATAAVGALTAVTSPMSASPIPSCSSLFVLQVDGTKGPGTVDSVDPESPLNRITARYVADQSVTVVPVHYPGSAVPIQPWGGMYYDESVRIGMDTLRDTYRALAARCPAATFRILGYSQGARIAGDFLEEVDRGDHGDVFHRVSGELYSDPREGIEAYLPGELVPGITFAGPRPPWRRIDVLTVCLPGDAVCGYRPGDSLPDALAGYARWHTQYGK